MIIFGADVGCKNLAYCILELTDGKLQIIEWNLINLCSDDSMCCKILRTKKKCNEIAKFYEPTNTHNKYCNKHKNDKCKKIKEDNKDNLYNYGRNLYDYLDNHPNVLKCDKYIIENQPSLKNPKMKSISMLLYSYFVYNKKSQLLFIHPTQKLKIHDKLSKEIISQSSHKYKATKILGTKYCSYILNNEVKNSINYKEFFNNHKKQDDLCDAFLHAYVILYGKDCKINDQLFIKEMQQ